MHDASLAVVLLMHIDKITASWVYLSFIVILVKYIVGGACKVFKTKVWIEFGCLNKYL